MATVDPSEVDRLADAWHQRWMLPSWGAEKSLQHFIEARDAFRAAAAVGARIALEKAPHDTECKVNWTEPSDHRYDDECDCWKSRAATYTPEQEDDNR